MTTLRQLAPYLHPAEWVRLLAGPIFDKELRVASRRRRNYVFRCVYLVLLGGFVLAVWLELVGRTGPGAYAYMQMSRAGREIVTVILWFQFIMVQLAALVMLSTAVSEELYRRTLGVLMTTPITGFQIVAGKLLGSLLQLVLLLAISLPLLALVRIFGGVPWEFVVAGLGITLTTAIFAGSLSLFFSIGSRRAYWVVLETVVAMFVLFFAVPWIIVMVGDWTEQRFLNSVIGWLNPYVAMIIETDLLASPRPAPTGFSWQTTCLALLAASAGLLALCVVRVRRAALAEISGEKRSWRRPRAFRKGDSPPSADSPLAEPIRRVWGSPVAWRELRTHLAPSRRYAVWGTTIVLGLMLVSYLVAWGGPIRDNDFHLIYIFVLLGLALLTTAVVAASGITSEKEAGSWPILLVAPLGREQILLGKAAGVLRRSLPVWLLGVFHLGFFTLIGYVHPLLPVHLAIIGLGAATLLTGAGLLASTVCRRTSVAVVLTLGFIIALWAGVPILALLVGELTDAEIIGRAVAAANPMVQVFVASEETTGGRVRDVFTHLPTYRWPDPVLGVGFGVTTLIIVCTAALNAYFGLALAALAAARLRRRIF